MINKYSSYTNSKKVKVNLQKFVKMLALTFIAMNLSISDSDSMAISQFKMVFHENISS